jgi:hypothetical protein
MHHEEEETDSAILLEEEGDEIGMFIQPLFNGGGLDEDISASAVDAMEEREEFGSETLILSLIVYIII